MSPLISQPFSQVESAFTRLGQDFIIDGQIVDDPIDVDDDDYTEIYRDKLLYVNRKFFIEVFAGSINFQFFML